MSADSTLDKSRYALRSFEERFQVAVLVVPVDKVGHYLHLLSEHLLNLPRVSNVASSSDFSTRFLLLNRSITATEFSTHPAALQALLATEHLSLSTHDLRFSYETYSAEDVLARLIPESGQVVWDYEVISHVVLLRLKESLRPYLKVIGEVFLDKTGKETVAATVGDAVPIVLAGVDNLEVMLKEGLCTFNFNLGQHLWSTRLLSERDRMLRKLNRSDVVLELGAGVGAFALQAAKLGCEVVANETNSSNFSRFLKNAISNRVSTKVHAYSLPPVDLVKALVQHIDTPVLTLKSQESYFLLKSPPISNLPTRVITQMIVDLPEEDTMEVLTAIYGLYKGKAGVELPTVHCYVSSSSEIPREDLLKRINLKWRFKLQDFDELKYVTSHKGTKRYYISFKLPSDVAFADLEEVESEGEVEEPRQGSVDLQQSMAADIEFMQRSMKEGLQPSLLMSHLASFIDTSAALKRRGEEGEQGGKRTKE